MSETAKTGTPEALLIVALQDLNDAEHAAIERLSSFQAGVSPGLGAYLDQERERAGVQAARLQRALDELNAPATAAPNIWLRAVLDDAARDYDTIVPGPLRDIALVGAFRKGKQAERVSYETAIGLAHATGHAGIETSVSFSREEEAAADSDLARLLHELLGQI